MDCNRNGSILRSFKRHHDIGARTGPSKSIKKILRRKISDYWVQICCAVLGSNFVLFISSEFSLIYLAAVLFAVGNGLMWPSIMSILSKRAGTIYQGAVQGVAGSVTGVASIIGLTTGGLLYNAFGGLTFLVSAGVIFAVFVLSFRLLRYKE
jgi:MFS family permease